MICKILCVVFGFQILQPFTVHGAALEIARANRDILKSFLGALKGADVVSHTRFVFITGVSKFSRVSIFSDLNNLIDITMSPKYANMLGYSRNNRPETDSPKRLCRPLQRPRQKAPAHGHRL